MWLVLAVACTAPKDTEETGDTGAPTGDTDTADPVTLPDDPGFYLAGKVSGEPFSVACSAATAVAGVTRDGEQVQLTAGCRDTSDPEVPTASLTISGETAGTYSDCSYDPGDALVQVGSGGVFVSCAVEGARAFDVVLTTVEPVGDTGLHFVGTLHWDTEDGSTDVDAKFDVEAAE